MGHEANLTTNEHRERNTFTDRRLTSRRGDQRQEGDRLAYRRSEAAHVDQQYVAAHLLRTVVGLNTAGSRRTRFGKRLRPRVSPTGSRVTPLTHWDACR